MTTQQRLGVVMDPIGAIKYAKDTTLAMLLAAQARGFALQLPRAAGPLGARRHRLRAHASADGRADPGGWFTLGQARVEPLSVLDVIC